MTTPSTLMDPETQPTTLEPPQPRRRKRPWWLSGKFWIGVLGTVLGAAGAIGVNEAVAWAFPDTDRATRLAGAIQGLAEEMRVNRDGVARLTEQLRRAEPGSPQATQIAIQLETSATALVQTSNRLDAQVTALSGQPKPAAQTGAGPATPPSNDVSPARSVDRTRSEKADSTPEPDVWLRTFQSTLIGSRRNALGVQDWSSTNMRVLIALNSQTFWLSAGDRVPYPDPAEDCYAVYLRTIDADPAQNGDERHGFALTCAPKGKAAR